MGMLSLLRVFMCAAPLSWSSTEQRKPKLKRALILRPRGILPPQPQCALLCWYGVTSQNVPVRPARLRHRTAPNKRFVQREAGELQFHNVLCSSPRIPLPSHSGESAMPATPHHTILILHSYHINSRLPTAQGKSTRKERWGRAIQPMLSPFWPLVFITELCLSVDTGMQAKS